MDGDHVAFSRPQPAPQLPTPADSAIDGLSDAGKVLNLKKVPKGKGTRVTTGDIDMQKSQDCLPESNNASRSVSGATLVTSTSQSSLLKNGIAALNMNWRVSEGDLAYKAEQPCEAAAQSLDEVMEKAEKAAAKKAKTEENARIRESKIKAADEKATRRSKRASMMDVMSGLASSVLGKRARDTPDDTRKSGLRPRSMYEPLTAGTPTFEGPTAKKRRLSEGDAGKAVTEESRAIPQKSIPLRKEKRWLRSGLYAGQSRNFDPRLTESKNRKKQNAKEAEPIKENSVLPLPMFAGERLLKYGRDFKLPFDIFSPLPDRQPKPDEWRKTNKNVFIGDAADYWRTIKFQEHSTCMCKEGTGCDDHCMNRFMFYECDERNCNLNEEQCGNRSFKDLQQRTKKGGKYNVGVEVIKTIDRGYGVRSNRTFEPNQIIVEYTGEIVTQEEAETRMHTTYKDNEVCLLTKSSAPADNLTVLLPDALRPEHDHRRHPGFHYSICQPLL